MNNAAGTLCLTAMIQQALAGQTAPMHVEPTEAQRQARFEEILQETVAARKPNPRSTRRSN